ncbi:MAG TPA: hypothetical protein VGO52_23145 [Hyphomonadaceae bacterium]|jgi:hypothetical protein|nr:hypothetical protein [Hyphomonadaceae bacterium]
MSKDEFRHGFADEFDRFVFHDAVERCGLKPRDAHAKVEFYASWIHQAIARLECAGSDAELRAALKETKQDIRNLEARHGWDGQLMSSFQKRQQAMPPKSSNDGSARIPATSEASR